MRPSVAGTLCLSQNCDLFLYFVSIGDKILLLGNNTLLHTKKILLHKNREKFRDNENRILWTEKCTNLSFLIFLECIELIQRLQYNVKLLPVILRALNCLIQSDCTVSSRYGGLV